MDKQEEVEKKLEPYKWVTVYEKEYGLVTKVKVDRVKHFGRKGKDGGYVFPVTNAPSDELYAELYDKHGGYIVDKELERVENGKFWDYVQAKPVREVLKEAEAKRKLAEAPKPEAPKPIEVKPENNVVERSN